MAKPRHEEREETSGRYRKGPTCDACNRSAGTDWITDEAVCGSTDGPGFILCERARCVAKREPLSVEERRALYTAKRAARAS